ncbi:MAG: Rpn family recombination-promoting nuclease/putative transposase [Alphaproteobacteria bacterium]|nr:Rpn family recombination-promoting nuclease/putative transposase [Alphaproteobacteria bacterium]
MGNYIRFDWAMKRLLRNKADHVVLEGFLSVIFKRQIKIAKILESEGNQDFEDQKFNRVDFLAEDEQGELMLFEIQNSHELDYFHRMAYGTSKVIADYLSKGEPYRNLKKVYSINIVYFTLGQGKGYAYHGTVNFVNMSDATDVLQLTDGQKKAFHVETVSQIFPEYFLFRVNNFDQLATSSIEEWISFLKTGEIPDTYTAQGLPEAREILRVDNLNEEDRKAYNRYIEILRFNRSVMDSSRIEGRIEGMEMGMAQGLEEGKAEGAKNEKLSTAKRMKAEGLDINLIAKITQLPLAEIEKL